MNKTILRSLIIKHKPWLKSLCDIPSKKVYALLAAASSSQLKTLGRIVHMLFIGEIPLAEKHLETLHCRRKLSYLRKHFGKKSWVTETLKQRSRLLPELAKLTGCYSVLLSEVFKKD